MPTRERLVTPLLRAWLQRGNQKAMDRLRATLARVMPSVVALRAVAMIPA